MKTDTTTALLIVLVCSAMFAGGFYFAHSLLTLTVHHEISCKKIIGRVI